MVDFGSWKRLGGGFVGIACEEAVVIRSVILVAAASMSLMV